MVVKSKATENINESFLLPITTPYIDLRLKVLSRYPKSQTKTMITECRVLSGHVQWIQRAPLH